MKLFLPTIILRHRKENLKKCSLRGLESRSDMDFFTYPKHSLPSLENHILLTIDAPELSSSDADKGLFLIDGTWKLAEKMKANSPTPLTSRSLPKNFLTAYPRRQEDCSDPTKGLASVEALYIAYKITGRDTKGLLDHYHWKEAFLKKNQFVDDLHAHLKENKAKEYS